MNEMEKAAQRFKGQYLQPDKIVPQRARKGIELPAVSYRFRAGLTTKKLGAYGEKH